MASSPTMPAEQVSRDKPCDGMGEMGKVAAGRRGAEANAPVRARLAGLLQAAALLALAGCAATPADFTAEEVAKAEKVRAYPASAIPPLHSVIGPVRSSSCDALSMKRTAGTEGEALWLLKLQTVRRGGDVLVNYACETRSLSPTSGCWQSRHCQGQAAVRDRPRQ